VSDWKNQGIRGHICGNLEKIAHVGIQKPDDIIEQCSGSNKTCEHNARCGDIYDSARVQLQTVHGHRDGPNGPTGHTRTRNSTCRGCRGCRGSLPEYAGPEHRLPPTPGAPSSGLTPHSCWDEQHMVGCWLGLGEGAGGGNWGKPVASERKETSFLEGGE
jgi:hypothetical protein